MHLCTSASAPAPLHQRLCISASAPAPLLLLLLSTSVRVFASQLVHKDKATLETDLAKVQEIIDDGLFVVEKGKLPLTLTPDPDANPRMPSPG